jgi:hypothetical protein
MWWWMEEEPHRYNEKMDFCHKATNPSPRGTTTCGRSCVGRQQRRDAHGLVDHSRKRRRDPYGDLDVLTVANATMAIATMEPMAGRISRARSGPELA